MISAKIDYDTHPDFESKTCGRKVHVGELMVICAVWADAVPGAQPRVVRLPWPCNAKLHVHESRDGCEWDTSD
jgi:hypothetical protein